MKLRETYLIEPGNYGILINDFIESVNFHSTGFIHREIKYR